VGFEMFLETLQIFLWISMEEEYSRWRYNEAECLILGFDLYYMCDLKFGSHISWDLGNISVILMKHVILMNYEFLKESLLECGHGMMNYQRRNSLKEVTKQRVPKGRNSIKEAEK
jgi:hypothetical protein